MVEIATEFNQQKLLWQIAALKVAVGAIFRTIPNQPGPCLFG
jgi:hypothetical protein